MRRFGNCLKKFGEIMPLLKQRKLIFFTVQQTAPVAQLETANQSDLQDDESKNDDHNENNTPSTSSSATSMKN